MTAHASAAFPASCSGVMARHIDGVEGGCSRGGQCTGGHHPHVEPCAPDFEACAYCEPLLCPAQYPVEHHDEVVECEIAEGVCTALEHRWYASEALTCYRVPAYVLTHNCGPSCGKALES